MMTGEEKSEPEIETSESVITTDAGGVTNRQGQGPPAQLPEPVVPDAAMTESTGSFHPSQMEAHDPSLNNLAKTMFQKSADYLKGELLLMMEDYKLLENLNKATAAKYRDMRQISGNVTKSLHELNDKYKSLEPLLSQIDQIEDSVNKLEQAAYKLDSYSKRLEAKFKQLEKRARDVVP